MKYFILFLFPLLMGCPPQDLIKSGNNDQRIKREKVDPAEYEMLTYVDLLTSVKLQVNEKESDLSSLCQSLFTAHAFNGHIVLSSFEIDSDAYRSVQKELKQCHFKYLQLQAADLYDKPYDSLSEKTQGTIQTMFPLKIIYARL